MANHLCARGDLLGSEHDHPSTCSPDRSSRFHKCHGLFPRFALFAGLDAACGSGTFLLAVLDGFAVLPFTAMTTALVKSCSVDFTFFETSAFFIAATVFSLSRFSWSVTWFSLSTRSWTALVISADCILSATYLPARTYDARSNSSFVFSTFFFAADPAAA